MIIGNIVTNYSIEVEDIFKLYSFDDIEGVDHSIPTFYIGFIETRNIFGKINPLDKQIDDLHYWSFSNKENTKELNKDLFRFKIFCHKHHIDSYKYYYISPTTNLTNIKKYIDFFKTKMSELNVVKGKNNMLYINHDSLIFGINLEMMRFMNINVWKILNRFREGSNKFIDYNSVGLDVKYFCDILNSDMYACIVI